MTDEKSVDWLKARIETLLREQGQMRERMSALVKRHGELLEELRQEKEDGAAWHNEAERYRMRSDELQELLWNLIEPLGELVAVGAPYEEALEAAQLWFMRHETRDEGE